MSAWVFCYRLFQSWHVSNIFKPPSRDEWQEKHWLQLPSNWHIGWIYLPGCQSQPGLLHSKAREYLLQTFICDSCWVGGISNILDPSNLPTTNTKATSSKGSTLLSSGPKYVWPRGIQWHIDNAQQYKEACSCGRPFFSNSWGGYVQQRDSLWLRFFCLCAVWFWKILRVPKEGNLYDTFISTCCQSKFMCFSSILVHQIYFRQEVLDLSYLESYLNHL